MYSKTKDICFLVFLLILVCRTVLSCECQNGGSCIDTNNNCACRKGFYGPICSNYADSYRVIFKSTPVDTSAVIRSLMENLETYRINETVQISPGNIFKLMFYKVLTIQDLEVIRRTINNELPPLQDGEENLSDFNECEKTQGQQKCYGEICANTIGSFTCGCPDGTKINSVTGKCEKDDTDTRPVIYIWSAVVVAVVLIMIALIIFYRWKKIEKGKKLQREMEKKYNPSYPTNMEDFDGTLRRSPMGSVFDVPLSGPGGRPVSAIYNPDGTSLYSYNSRMYSQSEGDNYSRHRLSAPVLENYPNNGYEGEGPNSDGYGLGPQYSTSPPGLGLGAQYSTSPQGMGGLGQQYSTSPTNGFQQFRSRSSEAGLAGIQEDQMSVYSGGKSADVIPTSFPNESNLRHDDRYEA